MAFMGFYPSIRLISIPLLIILMILTSSGLGMWLTAMAIQYRDINYAMSFFVQLLMYAAPVIYPLSIVPEQYRLAYGLFPMVGVIEGFRSVLLDTNPIPWDLIFIGFAVSILIFISGAYYFVKMERFFADVA